MSKEEKMKVSYHLSKGEMEKYVKAFEEIRGVFEANGFRFGRLISASKSGYMDRNPTNLTIFNARVYDLATFEKHKSKVILDFFKGQELEVWYGDLDLTKDLYALHLIAQKTGTFVVTRESGVPIITVYKN